MLANWLRHFIKQLFHYDRRRLDIEGAFALKHHHLPKTLYKFRSFTKSHLDALQRGVLYRSPPDAFNDPFDTAAFIKSDLVNRAITPEEIKRLMTASTGSIAAGNFGELAKGNLIEDILRSYSDSKPLGVSASFTQTQRILTEINVAREEDAIERLSSDLRSGTSVLSLSEALTSILMWSHYAKDHSGFAIAYKINTLPKLHPFCRTCFPVIYTDKPRNMSRYVFGENLNNLWLTFASMMKFSDWSYEKEWRVVLPLGPNSAHGEITTPAIAHIYLGANASVQDIELMRQFCADSQIPLSIMKLERASGLLKATPLQ